MADSNGISDGILNTEVIDIKMIDEIKKDALKILEKQCPDELKIYSRWERCIGIYAAGFRSVPQSLEEILKWYNCDVPYDHGYRVGELLVCLRFVNSAISSGASKKWSDKILSRTCRPQQRVFAELLYELNTRSEEQRLEVADKIFLDPNQSQSAHLSLNIMGSTMPFLTYGLPRHRLTGQFQKGILSEQTMSSGHLLFKNL